jgi:hypothetical protein
VLPTKKPADVLHSLAAPRELVDWVRQMPHESAARSAWVDATRAEWMPFLAKLRGATDDTILRATCECALETFASVEASPEATRVLDVLRRTAEGGRSVLATTETDLADLKLLIIGASHQTTPTARPAWMPPAEIVFELTRAASRGRILAGIALALKMLAHSKKRPAHQDLIARFRDKLVLTA